MTDKTENRDILEELSLLKDRLQKNEQLFNLAEEEALIEALVFERKAIMLRYSAAIERAKKGGAYGEELYGKGELKWRK
ncbi:MAG: hypothetical protein ACI4J7_01210 [Ruminiclostridium sp.]